MISLPLDIWFEIGAFVVAFLCYPSIKDKPLRWFVLYLFFIVVVELMGYTDRINNTWLYIFTIPVEYFFFSFIFYHEYCNKVFKAIALTLLFIIPIATVFNFVILHSKYGISDNEIINWILIGGSSMMIILSCLYFIDLFQREEEVHLLTNPVFWIATGVFFFNIGELPYDLLRHYIIKHRSDQRSKLFIAIHKILNYVLYTFVSIGLLCSKLQRRKT